MVVPISGLGGLVKEYASASAASAWTWIKSAAEVPSAAAVSRAWESAREAGSAFVDATVPTFLRQATAPPAGSNVPDIEDYGRVLSSGSPQLPRANFRPKTNEQRALFARNLSEFITMKTIYEFICGLSVDPADRNFYNRMMDGRNGLSEAERQTVLKTLFFDKVQAADISFLRKWAAYLAYYILSPLLHEIIETVSADLLKDIRGKIKREDETSKFATVGNEYIKYIAGYLETLICAYGRIRDNAFAAGTLDQEVSAELNKALEERGYTQAALNKKFTDKFVAAYGYTVKWTATLEDKLKNLQIPESSWFSLLNYPLSWIVALAAWMVWAVLYLPQQQPTLRSLMLLNSCSTGSMSSISLYPAAWERLNSLTDIHMR